MAESIMPNITANASVCNKLIESTPAAAWKAIQQHGNNFIQHQLLALQQARCNLYVPSKPD
jgi:hypothetical protein